MNRYKANNTRETRPDVRRVTDRALHAFQLPDETVQNCRDGINRSQFQSIDFCSFDFAERKTRRRQQIVFSLFTCARFVRATGFQPVVDSEVRC